MMFSVQRINLLDYFNKYLFNLNSNIINKIILNYFVNEILFYILANNPDWILYLFSIGPKIYFKTNAMKNPKQKKINKKIHDLTKNILKYLHQLSHNSPKEIKYLELLAKTHYEFGERESAIKYCNKALSLDTKCEEINALKNAIIGEEIQEKNEVY